MSPAAMASLKDALDKARPRYFIPLQAIDMKGSRL